MSYSKKIHSKAGIPFSWEDKPGISKFALRDLPINTESDNINHDLFLPVFSKPSNLPEKPKVCSKDAKLPLPPCRMQSLQRIDSSKGFRLEEDPFFVAYEECTRSVKHDKISSKTKKGIGSWARKKRFGLSCKKSCNVRDDNFVRLSRVPSLLQDRITKAK